MWPEGLCQMKYSNDTIGNRAHDLPACSAVHHGLGIKKLDKLVSSEGLTCVLRATDLVAEFISRSHRRFERHSLLVLLHTARPLSTALELFHLDFIIYRNLQNIHFTSLRFASLRFTSLHFTSLRFASLHFTSLYTVVRICYVPP